MKKYSLVIILLFLFSLTSSLQTVRQDITPFFSLNILTPDYNPAVVNVSQIIAENLNLVGINIINNDITSLGNISLRSWLYPFKTYNQIPPYSLGGYDVLLYDRITSDLEWDPSDLFASENVRLLGSNYYQFISPTFDSLLLGYLAELNPTTRYYLSKNLQAILYETLPSICIVYPRSLYVFKDSLTGIDVLLLSHAQHHAERWDDPDDHVIKYASPERIECNNTFITSTFFDSLWMQAIYGSLVQREQVTYVWEPVIAKNWTIDGIDPELDYPMNVTVNLDPNAKFSDGSPVLPEDIKYTYELHMTPEVNSTQYSNLKMFLGSNASIEITNPSVGGQLKFHFIKANTFFEKYLSLGIIDKSEIEPLISSHGYSIFDEFPGTGNVNWSLVKSCGPFKIKSYNTSGTAVELEPNIWWNNLTSSGSNAFLNELHFLYNSNKTNALSELEAGNIDAMDFEYQIGFVDVEGKAGIEGVLVKNCRYLEMSINMRHPIIGTGELTPVGTQEAGKCLRKAISHCIPRQQIVNNIYNGLAASGVVPMSDAQVGFDEDLLAYEVDLTSALDYIEYAFTPVVPELNFPTYFFFLFLIGLTFSISLNSQKLKKKK